MEFLGEEKFKILPLLHFLQIFQATRGHGWPTQGGCLKKTIWRLGIVMESDTISNLKVSRGYKHTRPEPVGRVAKMN